MTSKVDNYNANDNIYILLFQGGPDNSDKPFVWLKLEAIGNFEDPENVKAINNSLYNYLETEMKLEKVGLEKVERNALFCIFQDWVIINYYKLQATHVATQGKTVAEAWASK